jgi:hypothetical protein
MNTRTKRGSGVANELPSPASLKNVKKQGYLTKLGGKRVQKWKRRWFILDNQCLYYFADELASKPKGVIHLKAYRECEEISNEKKFTFRIFNSQKAELRVFYMKAETREEMQSWIDAIRKGLQRVHNVLLKYGPGTLRTEHELYVKLGETRNIKKEKDYYCVVLADNVTKARTMTVWKSKSPSFMQDFDIELEQTPKEFTIALKEDDKKKKDNLVGKVSIPLTELVDEQTHDGWYGLLPDSDDVTQIKGELFLECDYVPPTENTLGNFKVNVVKARNLTRKSNSGGNDCNPFVTVTYREKASRTNIVKSTSNPTFNASFKFDVREFNTSVLLQVFHAEDTNNGPGNSEFLGQVEIMLRDVEEPKNKSRWWKLGLPKDKYVGEIRLTLQFCSLTILPDMSYDCLLHVMLEDNMRLTKMFSAISTAKERHVADCLVKAFETRKTAVHFLKSILGDEIETTRDPAVLFRGNTVGTKSLDIYMRLAGLPYLQRVLKPIVTELYQLQGKKSCEIDVMRIEGKDKEKIAKKNVKTLIYYCQTIFDAIRNSLNFCPMSFRNIFEHIRQKIVAKWPNEYQLKYVVPSGLIFLRFFCPALLNPPAFGLVAEHPSMSVARDLTLITKTLQNLGNLKQFGVKEAFLQDVNPFLQENMELMKKFIDQLCTPPTTPPDEIPSNASINFGKEMSRIHIYLTDCLPRLKESYPNDPLIIKLEETMTRLNQELKKTHSLGQEDEDMIANISTKVGTPSANTPTSTPVPIPHLFTIRTSSSPGCSPKSSPTPPTHETFLLESATKPLEEFEILAEFGRLHSSTQQGLHLSRESGSTSTTPTTTNPTTYTPVTTSASTTPTTISPPASTANINKS